MRLRPMSEEEISDGATHISHKIGDSVSETSHSQSEPSAKDHTGFSRPLFWWIQLKTLTIFSEPTAVGKDALYSTARSIRRAIR